MKKFFLSLGLVLSLVAGAKAETVTQVLNGTGFTNVVVGPVKLLSIQLSSQTFTNGVITFLDAPNAFPTNWTGAFTNIVRTSGFTTNLYTNIFGVLSTNIYPSILATTNTAAGSMKSRAVITAIATTSNSVQNITYDSLYVANGILITNALGIGAPANITVVINYDELR